CIETMISPTGSTPLSTFQGNTGWRGANSAAGPGHKMKVTSSHSPSWDGSNASGFTALPAGYRTNVGGFYSLGSGAYVWTATEYSATRAWSRYLITGNFQGHRGNYGKTLGFSVRCLQN
ncbi:MAG: fibrobacter succinogenes major paralogous domain-containing protein, partial [Bacteroidales bacterium]|nr:fibrobacter succinogenes major paralogous domain-containing protein [Bacteroidales bacterium]